MKSLGDARATLQEDNFDFDKVVADIFVEKSLEVDQLMQKSVEQWTANLNDFESLMEISRGFHTLRTYGHNIGANSIGDIAWAMEFLLAEVVNEKVAVTRDLIKLITETKYAMPFLVTDFVNKKSPSYDPALVVLKANNLRLHKDIYAGVDIEEESIDEEFLPLPPPVRINAREEDIFMYIHQKQDDSNLEEPNLVYRKLAKNQYLSNNIHNISNFNPIFSSDKMDTVETHTDIKKSTKEEKFKSLSVLSEAHYSEEDHSNTTERNKKLLSEHGNDFEIGFNHPTILSIIFIVGLIISIFIWLL